MKTTAALAGGLVLLLATVGGVSAQVSGSVNVTGGATPSVTSTAGSTATGTSSSSASSDPVITNSGNTGTSAASIRSRTTNSLRNTSRVTASGGRGGQALSQVQVNVDPPAYSGGTTGTSNLNTNYSGSYTQTLRNVPEIVAPSVNGGANGCAVGVSGGVAVAGFGITTGAGWSDTNCERRNLAALVYNTGDHDLAAEILCDAPEVRAARLRMGKPCIADQPPQAVTVGATEATHIDPAILRRQNDTLASQQPIARQKPDWCATASAQELRSHHDCD